MIWQYFSEHEIACRCCGKTDMDYSFMAKLVNLRKTLNFPLPLNSAFRCWAHDKNVGGSENHPLGRAVDVNIYGYRAWRLIKAAAELGFTGIGIMQKGPWHERFVHLDDLLDTKKRPRPWIWTY